MRLLVVVLAAGLILSGIYALSPAQEKDTASVLNKADEMFKAKNYKDAAGFYQTYIKEAQRSITWHEAWKSMIICQLRLELFDEALESAERYVRECAGTPYEARALRFAGNLYMLLPHWGTRSGGRFIRGRYEQGIHVQSYRHDKGKAAEYMERARTLYEKYEGDASALSALTSDEAKKWREERIECLFDLAGIYARFGIYENNTFFWYASWGERDDTLAETAGEEDFDEYRNEWEMRRRRPIGLRLGPDGSPAFPTLPKKYSPEISDDEKILYLLLEVRELDPTKERKYTALSLYRQAMLSRARFGMDRLNQYAGMYWDVGRYPLQEELKDFKPWEMKDGEALILAGGKIRRVTLPEEWDVLALLRKVIKDYTSSGVADEAHYALALYYQTRQQYTTAIVEYEALRKAFTQSKWSKDAEEQLGRIRASQVQISQTGVQLPGEGAKIQFDYRNTVKVWFVARRIDHIGFMDEIRGEEIDPEKGMRNLWALSQWHGYFLQYNEHDPVCKIAPRYVGGEVARWSADVHDDGTFRYAQETIQAPMKENGAYLVFAYLQESPVDDALKSGKDVFSLGASRAVLVINDLAYVEKRVKDGLLYFICDARSGAPVANAEVSVLDVWSEWSGKESRNIYHKVIHRRVTDKDGMCVLEVPEDRGGQLHVLVKAGKERFAWSGMTWWSRYYPSIMEDRLYAYCITDRPVYRPGQTVRFKVWLRQRVKGEYQNLTGQSFGIEIYDPKRNRIYSINKNADQFGGIDGEFKLGEEPPLGVYYLQVSNAYIGGQNFRVEEYKKPEFEVTVEPGKSHVRLGEKVSAIVKAKYYFGAPVTDATVKYRVFREEYTHSWYLPGPWDWLYGVGYGLPWYEYSWFSWWGRMRCCWSPPDWWWGWYGLPAPNPVRELVQEGEKRIGEKGDLSIEIDTSPALREHPDRDHRYVIQAEVRDASRRVISGEGSVKVTRQAFYAFLQSDCGYYRPGEEVVVHLRSLTPDNKPVRCEGILTISSVIYGGQDNARIEEKEIERRKVQTDEDGTADIRLRPEKSGQVKFRFETPDSWGGVVEGYALVWVCGDDFDGQKFHFNELEIIADKRTYQPGETAHIMINTKRAGSYVLFSDEVDNGNLLSWRLLYLPQRHIIVDIPIKETHRPNFFVEATVVSDALVRQQAARLCVPPEKTILQLSVTTDKAEYRPGEKATVRVSVKTPEGAPAKAQVVLSVFDKSILYIQPEFTPPIAKFFYGQVRHHAPVMSTNLTERFGAWGFLIHPWQYLEPLPHAWYGIWGPVISDWHGVSEEEFKDNRLGYGAGHYYLGDVSRGVSARKAMALDMTGVAGAPASAALEVAGVDKKLSEGGGGLVGGEPAFAEAQVRKEFADTAYWLGTLVTDDTGSATATFAMPENLTTWKVSSWGMTEGTKVGQEGASAVTTKNLLVRLQAPRFFLEYDEVVLSANVHNYLAGEKRARVSLEVPEGLLKLIGETPRTTDVTVPAGGEARVDWRVRVLREGSAKVTVRALTDEESDAMQMSVPVLVHGVTKQVASTGSMRPDDVRKSVTVELDIPEMRRPELTTLEVRYSPTLALAMMDALPYCLYYPYGCTEQTMSRFLPSVLTLKTLQNMGIRLEDVKVIRGRMEEIRRINKGEQTCYYSDSPIFDEAELNRMVGKGLERITDMQRGDGGWGWWRDDESSPYLTCYVVYALCTAQGCDVKVNEEMVRRGMDFITNWEVTEMKKEDWSPSSQHAFVSYVLSMKARKAEYEPSKEDKRSGKLIERLFEGRDSLELYGKALLSLALANLKDEARARIVLQNIMQYKEENAETQVVWFRTPREGWWYWWNSEVETNAMILRAIVRLEPKSDVAPRLVKWLLNNRRNGYYWNSTRDTTLCIAAMSDFAAATGETSPDFTLTIDYDNGAVVKKVKINRENILTYDNLFRMEGVVLGGGKHKLVITKEGAGALYFNTYLRYFTKEEHITAAGHEMKVGRTYYKLRQIPYEVEVEGAQGQKVREKRLRYERIALKDGDAVQSGDILQVEFRVTSDNDYTYLCFEDMKPAGCEPTDVRSGGKSQEGFYSYMELRDEKVVFFLGTLARGEHLLRYRLRAETPGVFHALPTILYGMYAPELRANAEEMVIRIND
jgi:hypothetical protein